jgi:hypothetical protein
LNIYLELNCKFFFEEKCLNNLIWYNKCNVINNVKKYIFYCKF